MIVEHKFPFKWMQKAVNAFSMNNKPLSAFQIARKIGSCSSDAGEVVKMLVFLTQYGKIVNNDDKWRIEHISNNHDNKPTSFRVHYIRDLIILLENLSKNSARSEDLALITKKSESEITNCLNFLNSITKKGQLYLHKKRFPRQWGFRFWESQTDVSNEDN